MSLIPLKQSVCRVYVDRDEFCNRPAVFLENSRFVCECHTDEYAALQQACARAYSTYKEAKTQLEEYEKKWGIR